ncbi:hypothetical protein J8273_1564 [Carpediemonas membranifera]|uniref:Uncharacterized protein n=1 Tax=Carpediemonas membranifera TaxID=201153 RepID=A0A8J6AWF3_9EUKA|nr:hypothetical protein J8273_1564 [Carpediemonas membranifera]|eukprot:KAG9396556.1 hypothetical protein J8273_1564 [Carpediemonas membranifera]
MKTHLSPEQKREALIESLTSAKTTLGAIDSALKSVALRHEKSISGLQREVTMLRSENSRLSFTDVSSAPSECDSVLSEMSSLRQELNSARARETVIIRRHDLEVQALTSRIEELTEEIASYSLVGGKSSKSEPKPADVAAIAAGISTQYEQELNKLKALNYANMQRWHRERNDLLARIDELEAEFEQGALIGGKGNAAVTAHVKPTIRESSTPTMDKATLDLKKKLAAVEKENAFLRNELKNNTVVHNHELSRLNMALEVAQDEVEALRGERDTVALTAMRAIENHAPSPKPAPCSGCDSERDELLNLRRLLADERTAHAAQVGKLRRQLDAMENSITVHTTSKFHPMDVDEKAQLTQLLDTERASHAAAIARLNRSVDDLTAENEALKEDARVGQMVSPASYKQLEHRAQLAEGIAENALKNLNDERVKTSATIRRLQAQLEEAESSGYDTAGDDERLVVLRKKVSEYKGRIVAMQQDLTAARALAAMRTEELRRRDVEMLHAKRRWESEMELLVGSS